MKRTVLSIIAGVGLLALVPTAAMAHTDVSIGLNLGAPAPVYAEPAPVYTEPAPVYYYNPAPAYYAPGVAYRDDDWYRWHRHHEWQEHRWHEEHRWREEHEGDRDGWR
jgi:hypothetical protein